MMSFRIGLKEALRKENCWLYINLQNRFSIFCWNKSVRASPPHTCKLLLDSQKIHLNWGRGKEVTGLQKHHRQILQTEML